MKSVFWKRFFKNKIAVISSIIVVILFLTAIFGHIFIQDKSPDANNQNLAIKRKHPGFEVFMINPHPNQAYSLRTVFMGVPNFQTIPIDTFYEEKQVLSFRKYHQIFWQHKTLYQTHPDEIITKERFYLGTDGLGRDVLSRLVIGARVSMLVGLIAVIISLVIGSAAGLISGYYGGWIDRGIQWLMNVFWTIPTVLLAMALLMCYKGDTQYQIVIVFIAVGMTMWVETARTIRGLILELKERQFVQAGIALGFSDIRILTKHIYPNTFSTLIIITVSNFSSAILMESGLSYLGLGIQPPTPSWGSMLREYYSFLGTDVSYLAIFPGLCIMIAVYSFYGLGNGLRDALDIKGA